MKIEEVVENLCLYDERSPYFDKENAPDYDYNEPCYCDNCFYRRHPLAVELLKLLGEREYREIYTS